MSDSYYELLDVKRGLPNWKLAKRLYEVMGELKAAYGGVLPREFAVPLKTLGEAEDRDRYDSLLEWAESGQQLDFGEHADRLVEFAETVHHFQAQRLENGCVVFTNRSVPEPPPPPPPDELLSTPPSAPAIPKEPELSPPPRHTPNEAPSGPSIQDQYGRVGNKIPPVPLAKRVFTVDFGYRCYLESVLDLGDCFHFQWHQERGGAPPNRFAYNDYLAPLWHRDFIEVGRTYFIVTFTDTVTKISYQGAYCGIDTKLNAPLFSSFGLWDMFPWWWKYRSGWRPPAKYRWTDEEVETHLFAEAVETYQKKNPGRPVPPRNFFGHDGWTVATSQALQTFIYQTCYWSRALLSDWTIPHPDLDQRVRADVQGIFEHLVPLSRRERRKWQLP